MTSFARVEFESQKRRFALEISSLNSKRLEIHTSLPSHLLPFELPLRKIVMERIKRGKVAIRLFEVGAECSTSLPSLEHLRQVKRSFEELAEALGYSCGIDFNALLDLVAKKQGDEAIVVDEKDLLAALDKTLENLEYLSSQEGLILKRTFIELISQIEKGVVAIEKMAQKRPTNIIEKFQERVKELGVEMSEKRLLEEAFFFADREDIGEEITRMHAHIEQLRKKIEGNVEGKIVDFLLQEMQREMGTISAKSHDVELIFIALENRNLLEKLREQVQNIA